MKSMNYSLIRTICALVIGLVLVLWPDAAINYIVIILLRKFNGFDLSRKKTTVSCS